MYQQQRKIQIKDTKQREQRLVGLNQQVVEDKVLKVTFGDGRGSTIEVELSLEMLQLLKTGRIKDMDEKELTELVSEVNRLVSSMYGIENNVNNEGEEGVAALAQVIRETIIGKFNDMFLDMIFKREYRGNKEVITMREDFKEMIGWESIKYDVVSLALKLIGKEVEEVKEILNDLELGFESLEHVDVYNTKLNEGIKIEKISLGGEELQVQEVTELVTYEHASTIKRKEKTTEISIPVSGTTTEELSQTAQITRDEFDDEINRIIDKVPNRTKKQFKDDLPRIIDSLVCSVAGELKSREKS